MVSKLSVVILCIGLFFIFGFFIGLFFCICSYCIIKLLKLNIEDSNIFFYTYNKKCQSILTTYGNCKIKNIYLVQQPIGKCIQYIFNILTLFQSKSESPEKYLCHPSLLIELKKDKHTKFILVEKNNCINISESFIINKGDEIKKIKLSTTYTLHQLLQETQTRIGAHMFFNWNLFKNNCQEFTKEILITLNKYTPEYQSFIVRDKLIQCFEPSEINIHIVNIVLVIYNRLAWYCRIE